MNQKVEQDYAIINSEEYKEYLKALCKLASRWVSKIRVQFAEKAYEMYLDKTVRRIVMAYGNECDKLQKDRFREFSFASHFGATTPDQLKDTCLNNAEHYAKTLMMLFDIEF